MSIGVPYYTITSCCSYTGTQETFFRLSDPNPLPGGNGTYRYIGVTTVINGITFINGYCYTITIESGTTFSNYPIIETTDFDTAPVPDCNNMECEPCTILCVSFYELIQCCGDGQNSVLLCKQDETPISGTIKYTGPYIDFQSLYLGGSGILYPNQCYTVNVINTEGPTVTYPPFTLIENDIEQVTNCQDTDCQQCLPTLLEFRTCPIGETPVLFYTNYPNFTLQNPNSIKLKDFIPEQYRDICLWYAPFYCIPSLSNIYECAELPSPFYNVDWEQTTKYTLYESCDECTFTCWKLVNCSNDLDVVYVSNNLQLQFENQQVIKWDSKCWEVQQAETCVEPITITFTQTFSTCIQCLEKSLIYYKLTNCNDTSISIYTNSDLAQYVGKYITLNEYSDVCFYVEVYTGVIPSNTLITPTGDTFVTCKECSLPRYKLTDCTGIKPEIVTNNDLSTYVGDIVTLSTCPETCWTVSETTDIVPLVNVDIVDPTFNSCSQCLIDTLPIQCVSFTLESGTNASVTAWLPNGTSTVILLTTQEPSIKGCYLTWKFTGDVKATIFGNCIDNQCPEVPKPKRKVTPGYNTPTCSPEYYEKVECAFSEWMYKDVLEKRYGISNCCPEELMKWEIKHEMLMLDSLVNPDYDCNPAVNCGCQQPTTCNCSCNSGN